MKALTLTQPWATLMALQEKRIETRSWSTSYRGELVIHAAKGFPGWARETCADPAFFNALQGCPWNALPLSRGLCVVRLIGCIRTEDMFKSGSGTEVWPGGKELGFGDYSPGRFAWLTEYVRPIKSIQAVKGARQLWDWPEDVT